MPSKMKTVLDEAVKIANFLKPIRLFSALRKKMGSFHQHLLLPSEIRWLSRGKVLTRLFELRHMVRLFLMNSKLRKHFLKDFTWLSSLAYLADIFNVLNTLNSSLQGTSVTALSVQDNIIELSCDSTFKMLFPSLPLVGFGSKRRLFTLNFPKGL
jgi:hypothetical protein